MDLFFYLFVAGSWTTQTKTNFVWNSLSGAHGFAIFCSVIITILKVAVLSNRFLYYTSYILFGNQSSINERPTFMIAL